MDWKSYTAMTLLSPNTPLIQQLPGGTVVENPPPMQERQEMRFDPVEDSGEKATCVWYSAWKSSW